MTEFKQRYETAQAESQGAINILRAVCKELDEFREAIQAKYQSAETLNLLDDDEFDTYSKLVAEFNSATRNMLQKMKARDAIREECLRP